MRKLVESTYVSLDGMVSGGEFWGAQGQYRDDKHVAYAATLMEAAEALVLGRATYEVLRRRGPARLAISPTGSTRRKGGHHG